ncbi:MAG: YceI family protein [Labedaea sp.]
MPGRRHQIGPQRGRLILRTSRQGVAAQAGHDLTIEVARWHGELRLADEPAECSVEVVAETGSLRVLDGTGGVKPLSDRDKREIAANARRILAADRHPEARFVSTKITADSIDGTLTMLGQEHPFRLEITHAGDKHYTAMGGVLQSAYGVKPYTAFFGALKLADRVAIDAEINLSD